MIRAKRGHSGNEGSWFFDILSSQNYFWWREPRRRTSYCLSLRPRDSWWHVRPEHFHFDGDSKCEEFVMKIPHIFPHLYRFPENQTLRLSELVRLPPKRFKMTLHIPWFAVRILVSDLCRVTTCECGKEKSMRCVEFSGIVWDFPRIVWTFPRAWGLFFRTSTHDKTIFTDHR